MHQVRRGERGQSLVIVLSLITLLFLLGSSIAVHASVALRATRNSDAQADDFYAADAATELGIWWQRNGRAGNPPAQTINGVTTSTTITSVGGGGGSCPADNTPVWMNGFEMGTVPSVSFYGNAGASSGVTADTSVVRTGTYSARVSPTGGWTTMSVGTGAPFGQVTVLHEAFQFAAVPGVDAVVTEIIANGNMRALLYYKASTGKWTIATYASNWASRTEVGGTVGPVAGQWQTIDIRYQEYVNPIVVDWSINGTAQPQHTSATTGSTLSTGLGFGQAANATTATYTGYFDDIMVSATSSDYPLPDIRINALKPNGMGTHNTPGNYQNDDNTAITATSWQRVDDIPMTPITDWIKQVTTGAGSYIEFAFEDTTKTCVRGASVFAQVRSAGTQANNQVVNAVTNGFSYTIWSGTIGSTVARYVQRVVSQNAGNPGTGPWTQAIVNGIVARWGLSNDASPVPYLDGIVLEYAWLNVVASPATVTIVGAAGGSTTTTTYTDAGAGVPTLSTWTTTK